MRPTAAALLTALALTLPAASAQATDAGSGGQAPWRAAGQVRDSLFDAQQGLLLGERATALRSVAAARRSMSGQLDRGLRSEAAGDRRRILAGLAAAGRAARSNDPVRMAAARGEVRGALLSGSYVVTLAAAGRGDARTARQWLLLRNFRRATRFTRPGVDATVAVERLRERKTKPGAARLAVEKDLLDAYQSQLRLLMDKAEEAAKRGFDARRAEVANIARAYWSILSERYRQERGSARRDAADRDFDALAEGAIGTSARRYRALNARAKGSLEGFTAAPFTDEEEARRAGQLTRFLDLVPVEYGRGVDDGKVTKDFEIQEAIAFRDGAEGAFSDLQSALERTHPRQTEVARKGLAKLKADLDAASKGGRVVDKEAIEDTHGEIKDAFDASFPKKWKEGTEEGDFDLIQLTLDRLETAAAAGQWKQAEQARLEAYAFFEFGPELQLRSLAPDITANVEGLVWFGAQGKEGYADLIDHHAPRRDFSETRVAIDEQLGDAQATLGEGAGKTTVITNAAVIVFREGLEAVLILAAVMAGLQGANAGRRRPMLIGAGLALVASGVTYALAATLLTSLSRYGEKLEAVVGLVAIAVLLLVMNWFFHKVYWSSHISKFHKRRKRMLGMAAVGGFISVQVLGFVMLGFSTVYREGFETVLFLQALQLSAGTLVVLEGVALGMVGVLAVAVATFALQKKLPYKRMLVITGVMLGVVLLVMVGKTVRTLQGVGWMPITPVDTEMPFWLGQWLGVFPTVETIAAQVLAGVFVIGSYFAAEYVRKTLPARRARRGHGTTPGEPAPAMATEPPVDEESPAEEPPVPAGTRGG